MIITTLKTLYTKDLLRVKAEIESYQDERKIWHIEKSINNSAGNLCLHLAGNLNTYIGAVIGKTGYIRNRELEFSQKDVPRADLIRQIEETIAVVGSSLNNLKEGDLATEYPVLVWDDKTSTEYLLIHLATHLAYHLGQINYHRRLLDPQ